jgi:hypothetical protein
VRKFSTALTAAWNAAELALLVTVESKKLSKISAITFSYGLNVVWMIDFNTTLFPVRRGCQGMRIFG